MPRKNTADTASSATTVPSSATTTASSSWSIIQSPPSTLTPIVESENFTREISNIEAKHSNMRKLLDEADMEGIKLELDIKCLRDDNEDFENKLEKTKNLQIAERNAMIHEKWSSDLQSWVKCKTLTEKQSDRSKALLDALKHGKQGKEQIDFTNVVISRALCISWTRPIEGSIFLPQMAYMQTQRRMNSSDIIHQALKEVLCMFSRGEDPLIDVSSGREGSPYSQASSLLSLVGDSSFCQLPLIPIRGDNSSEPKSFTYLLDCYSRIAIEERNHGKQSSVLLSDTLSDVVTILKAQCVHYSSLVLQGLIGICQAAVISKRTTYLYYRILSRNLPWGYLRELVARTYTNLNMFDNIFTPVLKQLYIAIHGEFLRQYAKKTDRGARRTDRDSLWTKQPYTSDLVFDNE